MSAAVTLDRVSKRFSLQHHKARSFQEALVNLVHRRICAAEEFWALKDVTFDVQVGETLGIVGENGSGKSTVLKLITRILEPTSGRVDVNGRVSALIELGAGFHPDLTGRENIYLNGSILGFSRREMDRKLDEIVAFSEMERFIDTPVKHYSSGMYARLGFSVAISVDPDILIIDEVLAVGDEVFQRKCFDKIREFRRRGKTIIFVSHALPVVEQLCDRVVWLHQGHLRSHGPARPVIRDYVEELQRHDEENRELAQRIAASWPSKTGSPQDVRPKEVDVLRVQLLSGERQEKYSFRTGETLIVRVNYRAAEPDGDYVIGLELRRSDGLLIHLSSQKHAGPLPVDERGEGQLEIGIEYLPLLAGTYELAPIIRGAEQSPGPDGRESGSCVFSVWSEVDQQGIVAMPLQPRRLPSERPPVAIAAR